MVASQYALESPFFFSVSWLQVERNMFSLVGGDEERGGRLQWFGL